MRKEGCGIADNYFEAAFEHLCLHWVRLVSEKKGLAVEVSNNQNVRILTS